MKKILFFILTLLVASCIGNTTDDCADTNKPQLFDYQPNFKRLKVDEARLERVDALLQEYVDQGIIPHALTFVAKNGQVIHNKAFGWKDVEKQKPLKKDDIFRMYSQTKAIVTVALMTLFEQGKFQLDDPVSKYLPEMTDQVLTDSDDPTESQTRKAESPVLIRHLMAHTSGIAAMRRSPLTPPIQHETLEEYVKELVQLPLIYEPGTKWNYHPASDVMAYLVEYFSGKPLQEYLQEAIFDPLSIEDMAYYYGEEDRDKFVTIYRENSDSTIVPVEMWSGRNPFGDDRLFAQGGTGLNGTIEGYARFCQMILNGGIFNHQRILGRRTIEVMSKDQLMHPGGGDANFRYGLGFQIYPGESSAWDVISNYSPMVSAGALSWGGMANTDYIIDPKEDMIILFYMNRIPDPLIWEKFLNTVYQVLE